MLKQRDEMLNISNYEKEENDCESTVDKFLFEIE
ncbi:protein of unknown function [Bartonella clarridgeiae 73]|uniref:Uncharacterized protein n=1 Tax=Bartonella clarridgeiae (strain CCUG 45776 / CIP 104772 / 73) TaxID=696125 RepID=E6YFV5_BARC7|nr:protein of unknown function [Bartonella clarridgeiae 73]